MHPDTAFSLFWGGLDVLKKKKIPAITAQKTSSNEPASFLNLWLNCLCFLSFINSGVKAVCLLLVFLSNQVQLRRNSVYLA